jgi:hypothetical protein
LAKTLRLAIASISSEIGLDYFALQSLLQGPAPDLPSVARSRMVRSPTRHDIEARFANRAPAART